jgi:hypothetical protein
MIIISADFEVKQIKAVSTTQMALEALSVVCTA